MACRPDVPGVWPVAGAAASRFTPTRRVMTMWRRPSSRGLVSGTVAWQADLLYNGSVPVADEDSSDWQVGLQGGHLLEQNRWLSGEGAGALDVTGAQTSFAGVSLEQRTQHRWAWRVAAYQGWTSTTTGGQGLLAGTEGLRSRSWVAGLDRLHVWRPGDRLGLQVYEPMRVEGGRLRLRLPTGRDRYGQLNYETVGCVRCAVGTYTGYIDGLQQCGGRRR